MIIILSIIAEINEYYSIEKSIIGWSLPSALLLNQFTTTGAPLTVSVITIDSM